MTTQAFLYNEADSLKLPELCYSVRPDNKVEVVLLVCGERGYWHESNFGDPAAARAHADEMNQRLGVTPLQERAMLNGSLFGFDVPGADPVWLDKFEKEHATN